MRRASRPPAIMVAAATIVAVGIRCTEYDAVETEARDGGAGVVEGGEGGQQTDGRADAADATDAADASGCSPGLVLLGWFVTHTGKVNVHSPASTELKEKPGFELNGWFADPDCTSGADKNDLAYCQRLWPAATERLGPFAADSVAKPFFTALCSEQNATTGREAFLCCGTR